MALLTDQAWQTVLDLSRRYGVSTDAVTSMLYAVANGGGSMAQFNVSELGGGGQWMRGGMTMVGDMFNHGLKAKVDGLCGELSNLLASSNPFVPPPPPVRPPQPAFGGQSQQQGGGSFQQQGGSFQQQGGGGASMYFGGAGGGYGNWWPAELGSPNGSGGQNNVRYAYFSNARRLAVEFNGTVTVYDTLDHSIGGVSQQQGGGASVTFTSQYGTVPVTNLPVVSINGVPQNQPQPQQNQPQNPPMSAPQSLPPLSNGTPSAVEADVFAKIEQLANLRQKGYVTDDEFNAKKAELLSRL